MGKIPRYRQIKMKVLNCECLRQVSACQEVTEIQAAVYHSRLTLVHDYTSLLYQLTDWLLNFQKFCKLAVKSLVPWNWPWRKYLHGNQQMLQIRAFVFFYLWWASCWTFTSALLNEWWKQRQRQILLGNNYKGTLLSAPC